MPNSILAKSAGTRAATGVISAKSENTYPTDYDGASSNLGANNDELQLHFTGSPSLTAADAILTAIALPTCTSSGLDITTDCGTYVVADSTSITADGSDTKYVLMSIQINDSDGAVEVLAREKTTGSYAAIAGGKTLGADLKEFSVPASGSTLTETQDYI